MALTSHVKAIDMFVRGARLFRNFRSPGLQFFLVSVFFLNSKGPLPVTHGWGSCWVDLVSEIIRVGVESGLNISVLVMLRQYPCSKITRLCHIPCSELGPTVGASFRVYRF